MEGKAADREKWKGITEVDDKWREKAADTEKRKGITEEDDMGREKAADREKWKGITTWVVQQQMNQPQPFIKGATRKYI